MEASCDMIKGIERAIDNQRSRMRYQAGTILSSTSIKSLMLRCHRRYHKERAPVTYLSDICTGWHSSIRKFPMKPNRNISFRGDTIHLD